MKIILLASTICCLVMGCSSSSETTTTETTTIQAVVPEIHGIAPVIQDVVPIQSLPESTQTVLIGQGFEPTDSAEVTTAQTQTNEGSIDATIYKPLRKANGKKPLAVLNAKPKSPIQATQTNIKSTKQVETKPWYQPFVDLLKQVKWIIIAVLGIAIVVLFLKFTGMFGKGV